MHYIAGLLFVVNVAFFGYEFAFKPTAPSDMPLPPPGQAALKLVGEVASEDLVPREVPAGETSTN